MTQATESGLLVQSVLPRDCRTAPIPVRHLEALPLDDLGQLRMERVVCRDLVWTGGAFAN